MSEGNEVFAFSLNSVLGITLDDFRINTNYVCIISASTSGGAGPSTSTSATTESKYKCDRHNNAFYSNKNSCSFILVVEDIYLPFIAVGNVTDTDSIELPNSDDVSSDAINTPPFPFGDSIQTTVFVRP